MISLCNDNYFKIRVESNLCHGRQIHLGPLTMSNITYKAYIANYELIIRVVGFLGIINCSNFYLKRLSGDWVLSSSSGKMPTVLGSETPFQIKIRTLDHSLMELSPS
jgi:hypothetical protein